MSDTKTEGVVVPEIEDETIVGIPFKVILYNDDWHSFEEVINQLMKALKCNFEKARGFAFEAHVRGKAIVFDGQIEKCLKVASILEEIALHVEVAS
ncbi:MAG: ATP-dependent Clp protease adaptor ClpS [bacterium]